MKKIIQLFLFLFLIVVTIIFYKTYFSKDDVVEKKLIEKIDDLKIENENNLIKNLKYDVRLDDNKQYIITANLSELTYEDGKEIVKMEKVIGIFVDKDNVPITITSNYAVYNNSTYDTNFYGDVKVQYIDNIILSDKLDLSFVNNSVLIYNNVNYEGFQGSMKTDNIKIDLVTKNIEIYMNDKVEKIQVISKK
jgi:Organic solvent tolerance protein OstA